jgi:YHS domain-containing protein
MQMINCEKMKPFEIFICHKKSSGKDFAEHIKLGLEELGYHTFLDSKDIPKIVDGKEEWAQIRDKAIKECKTFILLITPGFDLSPEVRNELKLARQVGNKQFIYFRHRNLARKIIVDLETEKVDLGKQEQVSFETKEELLRLIHGILSKSQSLTPIGESRAKKEKQERDRPQTNIKQACAMCSKPIGEQSIIWQMGEKTYYFDSKECEKTFKKFRSLYGEDFK